MKPEDFKDIMENFPRIAEALDFPTRGKFATDLWYICSSALWGLSSSEAAALYRSCGYEPFMGYPLVKAGKIPSMTRAECLETIDQYPQYGRTA